MKKNVTLSAEEVLIRKARERASRDHTTLNGAFRAWLSRYAAQGDADQAYAELMDRFAYARPGRRFTRDEANER